MFPMPYLWLGGLTGRIHNKEYNSKGADRRIGIAQLILSSGSRRRCVVSNMPWSIYPWERDMAYIAKFLEKCDKFHHSTSCYMQNTLHAQCIHYQDSCPDILVHADVARGLSNLLIQLTVCASSIVIVIVIVIYSHSTRSSLIWNPSL
jgi:hypothetical protein